MAKQKRDYGKLKLEFFESEFDEFEGFFKDKYKTKTDGNIRLNTKGRGKEKKEYKEKILQKALEMNAEKKAKELEIDVEVLQKGKRNGLIQIIKRLSHENDLSIGDIVKGVNAIKTELGEPTSYQKTDSTIKDEISDKNPLKEKLLILKQNKGNINSGKKKK